MPNWMTKYQIGAKAIESLKTNEAARWEGAADDLATRNAKLPPKQRLSEDQSDRLTALALMVDLGIIKRTFPIPSSQPVAAAVGEPQEG